MPNGALKGIVDLLDKNISVYQYNLFMKETLASYKYRGDAVIAEFFAPKLYDLYMKHFRGYVVIPIPLSPQRLIERGFNQSELLLTGWKNATIHPVLQRKEREKQSKKSRRLRLPNKASIIHQTLCFSAHVFPMNRSLIYQSRCAKP